VTAGEPGEGKNTDDEGNDSTDEEINKGSLFKKKEFTAPFF